MNGQRTGTTMVEILIVALIASLIMLVVQRSLMHLLSHSARGQENLSVLQEEGRFMAFLKHDLRTLIMGGSTEIPAPVVESGADGTTALIFYKVEDADEYGRPLPVRVEYRRHLHTKKYQSAAGQLYQSYTIIRKAGEESAYAQRHFMTGLVATFGVTLLDSREAVLPPSESIKARKIHVELGSFGSPLLKVTATIYSPYISALGATSTANLWLPNYKVKTYPLKPGLQTYGGQTLQAADMKIIPGANAIVLSEE